MYDGVPFSGKLVKLRLKSNALSYGPIPEQDTEIEQKLEVSVKRKTARLSCYNFGNGSKYLLNQAYVRRESEKDIADILTMLEAVFSAYEPTGFVCDGGSWELVLTNDKKERFHYEGTLCMDFRKERIRPPALDTRLARPLGVCACIGGRSRCRQRER